MRFKDKVVVVTGGSAGIGGATADRFAREAWAEFRAMLLAGRSVV